MKCDVSKACSDPPFFHVSRRWSQWTSSCSVWTQSKTESCGFGRTRRERSGPWTSRSDLSARRPSSHANTHPRARRPRTDSTLLYSHWDLFCPRLEPLSHPVTAGRQCGGGSVWPVLWMKMSGLCGRLRFPVVQAWQLAEAAQEKRDCEATGWGQWSGRCVEQDLTRDHVGKSFMPCSSAAIWSVLCDVILQKRPAWPHTHEFAATNTLPLSQILHPDKEAVLTEQRRHRLKYLFTCIHPGSITCVPACRP